MSITATHTVRELAVTMPGATRVFERMGIDYCCGGGSTLADACNKFHVPIEEIVRSLEEAGRSGQSGDDAINWQTEPLTDLCSYIVDKHHVFTRQELERLEKLLDKVSSRHGENHPELSQLQTLFLALKQDLLPHMLKEEQVLFPYINLMEAAVTNHSNIPTPFFATVQNPVRMMMNEHDTVGDLLRQMRAISGNYVPPPDACISYQTLYQALAEFEADLHQHIHLENNILFPRAVEMEAQAEGSRASMAVRSGCFVH